MRSYLLFCATYAITWMQLAHGQASVPKDLSSGFATSGTQMQASFTGDAPNGFTDGTTFTKDQVSKEPSFALGDASGISSTALYTIIMLDTTNSDDRTLHYARANFKYNFEITNIDTQSQAIFAYKAPGTLGETGERKYTFLMYDNPNRAVINTLRIQSEGQNFDVNKFQSENGLGDASAGVGMVVMLGGGQGNAPLASNVPAASAPAASAPSSRAPPANAPASNAPPAVASTPNPSKASSPAAGQQSSTAEGRPSRTPAGVSSASVPVATSVVAQNPTPTVTQRPTPVRSASSVGDIQSLSPTAVVVSATSESDSQGPAASEAASDRAGEGSAFTTSTVPAGIETPTTTGSRQQTAAPAVQTTNGAAALGGMGHCVVIGVMFMFAGLMV